jgi:hypothetical protein
MTTIWTLLFIDYNAVRPVASSTSSPSCFSLRSTISTPRPTDKADNAALR